ncbi:MAG TPA: sugar phosphate isomerase/epimerase family protein [Kribbella sp.]|uniref:sugar phosphate isomerase/epimerase family protein n=1 Tax=Kribbella sp. TaxID=1871183 RepID=UPI002D79A682|nr:sugar phosphate isomerase/epimerase family protein [Kribbella sp.]HET6298221.1 sugar phosphate isomerase/epimerase family protein [Kribbella sp.]
MNRYSLNQATTKYWSLEEVVAASAEAGLSWIGLWREPIQEYGVERSAKLVADAGLRVSSLCRSGFFTATDAAERRTRIDDNRRAIDEAATVGTGVLILVSGGLPTGSRDIDGAREMVRDGLAELAPYAEERGVRLAVEALHPMFCSDRCVVSSLGGALDLAEQFPASQVGVVVDAYHLWWDAELYRQIERAGDRICSYQVSDWVVPLPADTLLGRGMMGDGSIELRRMREACDAAGYDGPVEVEIFNQDLWNAPGQEVFDLALASYREHVA